MKLAELTTEEKIVAVNSHAKRALKFSALDHCANIAREHGIWLQCANMVHERNMTLLGKTRQGYRPAVWKKGFHEVIVVNEHTTIRGEEVHVRKLCKKGYRFIPVRKL